MGIDKEKAHGRMCCALGEICIKKNIAGIIRW
jgi:hypothetical protein